MSWKRVILLLALTPLIGFGLFIGSFVLLSVNSYIAHNQKLRVYENEFRQIGHPANTSVVASESRVTRPPGNGDNCFYLVSEVRKFEGRRSDVEAFYQGKRVTLEFLENGQFGELALYGLNQLSSWRIVPNDFGNNLYLVYTLDTDLNEVMSLDLRCT